MLVLDLADGHGSGTRSCRQMATAGDTVSNELRLHDHLRG